MAIFRIVRSLLKPVKHEKLAIILFGKTMYYLLNAVIALSITTIWLRCHLY